RSANSPAAAHDPIRIVPLNVAAGVGQALAEAAPAAAADLTYRGGPLLTAVEVFTVFWGGAWRQAPQSGLVGQLTAFFDFILTSRLIDQLSEYDVKGSATGHGAASARRRSRRRLRKRRSPTARS